jgi:tRNA A-37 threonylcarbamoyl transferase component Bud32
MLFDGGRPAVHALPGRWRLEEENAYVSPASEPEPSSVTAALESVREALAGRYDVDCEIGRGASAAVYLAKEVTSGRAVAVKVLHAELAQALGAQRFLREIRVAASLSHPHLVPIEDSGQVGDVFYYVSPYLADGSLRARLRRERQLSVEDAVLVARDVGDALQQVHAHGIVHRDIKPENILFSGTSACLADFGIARAVDSAVGDTITSTGLVVGTPTYMSPEQGSGDRSVDARSDQYSFACVVYEMIAGLPPFIGASAQAVIAQRFAHKPLPLSHYRPSVPAGIEAAVARALSLTPADRYSTIGAFVAALGAAAPAHSGVTGRNVAARITRRITRRRWFVAGAATALVVLAVLGFTQGYSRVQGMLSPALDTTKYVVLPFEGGAASVTGAQVADAIYAGLREWSGLPLVEDLVVRDAIGSQRTNITSLGEAISTAAAMGAGRLVWGRIAGTGDALTLRAAVYDVASSSAIRHADLEAPSENQLRASIPGAVDALLRLPGAGAAPPSGMGTKNYAARQAFERGEIAYARGALPAAHASYAAAAAADPQFARAHLQHAVLGMLLDDSSGAWVGSSRIAAGGRAALPQREAYLSDAILALADGRHPEACAAFGRAHPSDSSDFAVWYGLGECRYRDSIVVRSRASRSGWTFRSSYHSAARSFLRAAARDPRAYDLPLYPRLRRMLKTELGQLRSGRAGQNAALFAGYPDWTGDTLGYTPYPVAGSVPAEARPETAMHERALERNAAALVAFIRDWNVRRPASAAPLLALADVLESRGEVTEASGSELGALSAVRRVRAMTSDRAQLVELRLREFRLLVRSGAFSSAAALADSLLGERGPHDEATVRALQATAAMTGRLSVAVRAGVSLPRTSLVDGAVFVAPLVASAAALDARAALGACGGVAAARARLDSTIEAHVPEQRWGAVRDELTALPGMWAASCTDGASALWASGGTSVLQRALRAFAMNQRADAGRLMDSLEQDQRDIRPGDVSLDYTLQAVWLRTALGDSTGAGSQLDRVLRSLPTHRSTLFTRMSEAAALPRAMALRAELAAAAGDRDSARQWATAALALWRKADAELAPLLSRLRSLAAS